MINPSTARLAMTVAILGSVWAFVQEYLHYQEGTGIRYWNLVLAFVIPAALYWVIRVNRE